MWCSSGRTCHCSGDLVCACMYGQKGGGMCMHGRGQLPRFTAVMGVWVGEWVRDGCQS